MSDNLEGFEDHLDAQEESLGERVRATITSFATDKDCVPSAGNSDLMQLDGGSGMSGGYTLQMRKADFNGRPTKGASVTVSCYPDDSLELTSDPEESGGIYTLRVGDLAQTG